MKICLTVLLLFFCGLVQDVFSSPLNAIEINLTDKEVDLVDFRLGNSTVSGVISFSLQREGNSSVCDLEAKNISLNNKHVDWAKARLTMRGQDLFINYLSLPQYTLHGKVDLKNNDLALAIDGTWEGTSETIEGKIHIKAKVWGKIGNFLTSGYLTVENGTYEGEEFSVLRLDFLGKPPLLNITDSKVILKDGTEAAIEGVLDLGDFSNLIPGAEFHPQKVYVGEWQLFSEAERGIGLKKNLDDKFDVYLNTNRKKGETEVESTTELRYNWKDNKFFRLKMQEDKSILQFEQRKDF